MSVVQKGIVLAQKEDKVRVQSVNLKNTVSPMITVAAHLKGQILDKGTKVAYVIFDDGTGLVIDKMED